jgi:hypothetical protein
MEVQAWKKFDKSLSDHFPIELEVKNVGSISKKKVYHLQVKATPTDEEIRNFISNEGWPRIIAEQSRKL